MENSETEVFFTNLSAEVFSLTLLHFLVSVEYI